MKRDMELVRKILIVMEDWPSAYPPAGNPEIKIEGYTAEQITHHIGLMSEAGLIKAADANSFDGEMWLPIGILWAGHEFLDAARSDTMWDKAKELAISKTGSLTLEGMKVALAAVIKHAISGSWT